MRWRSRRRSPTRTTTRTSAVSCTATLVADFGIALAVAHAGGGRITETGLSLGTPHYMSPEQATGDREVDPRSDVFSLACVLYEMLAGEPPFSASTAQAVFVRILTTDAPSITDVRRTVEPHVAATLANRVPVSGGPIEVVTQVDTAAGDLLHVWVDPLPGGEAAVYNVMSAGNDPRIFAVRLESDLFVKNLGDDTPARSLITLHFNEAPTQWPSDELIVFRRRPAVQSPSDDLWMLDLSDPDSPAVAEYLLSQAVRGDFMVSPDGTLAAYTSDETGTPEVYIRSFPDPGERTRVSAGGGEFPFWSPEGDIVYYWTLQGAGGAPGDEFMAARIQRNPTPVVLSRKALLTGDYYRPATDLHPDGDRIIVAKNAAVTTDREAEAGNSARFILVQNWLEELRERTGN